MEILLIIGITLLGNFISLAGGSLLFTNKKTNNLNNLSIAFAAGALLAAAFIDLIPESIEHGEESGFNLENLPYFILLGILVFFLLESALHWFHHHHHSHNPSEDTHTQSTIIPLLVTGDTIHNFIDGIAIAAGFLLSPFSGVIVTLAVACHEIPQELGDFGVMLALGMKKSKVFLINFISSLASTIGAIIFYIIGKNFELPLAPILAFISGFFIYISLTDLIPTIHHETNRKKLWSLIGAVLIGVIIVGFFCLYFHQFIEVE